MSKHYYCHASCVLLRSMAGPLLPTPEQEPLADQYVGGLAGNRRFYNMANEGRIQPIIGNASLMMRSCGLIECRLCWATPSAVVQAGYHWAGFTLCRLSVVTILTFHFDHAAACQAMLTASSLTASSPRTAQRSDRLT